MKIERIVADVTTIHSPVSAERVTKDEKHTLTADAVTFEGEREKPEEKHKFTNTDADSEQEDEKEETLSRKSENEKVLGKQLDVLV